MSEPMYDYGDMIHKGLNKITEPNSPLHEDIPENIDMTQKVIDPKRSREIRKSLYTASYYQHEASRTLIDEPGFELTIEEMMILWNADGLAGEVGEMMDMVKKSIWHRHGVDKLYGEEMKKELGDICWYLAALCTKLGFDLGDVMYTNIEKLKKRFPDGYEQEKTIVGKRLDEIDQRLGGGEDIEITIDEDGFRDKQGNRYTIEELDKELNGKRSSDDISYRNKKLNEYDKLIREGKYMEAANIILNLDQGKD